MSRFVFWETPPPDATKVSDYGARVAAVYKQKPLAALKVDMSRSAISIVFASLLGAAAGSMHLYMRFANNTQGEMFDRNGHIDIAYSALLFIAAFVPVFGIVLVFGAVILFLFRLFRRANQD